MTYHFGSLFSYIVLIAVNKAVLWFPSVVAQHCVAALSLFDSLFATLSTTGVVCYLSIHQTLIQIKILSFAHIS